MKDYDGVIELRGYKLQPRQENVSLAIPAV